MTSVLMIFEMTHDYAVIVPLDDRQPGEPFYFFPPAKAADL